MTQPPNPIMQGFRAVRHDPALFLLEIIWRWSFAAIALLIVLSAGLLLLDRVHTDSFTRAIQTKDPRMIGASLFFTWLLLGMKAVVAVVAVPLAIAFIWACFAAPARRITVRRLRAAAPLTLRAMFALQMLRAFVTWTAYLLVIGAITAAIHFATHGSKYDPAAFYSVAAPSIVLIAVIWLALNWYLTLATIFGREGQSFRTAFRHARQTVRLQRSDFAGTGFVFLFFRLILLVIVLAICGLASGLATTAAESYAVLVMILALAFFAVSDSLYMARMAAYVALAGAREKADTAQPPVSSPEVSVPGS